MGASNTSKAQLQREIEREQDNIKNAKWRIADIKEQWKTTSRGKDSGLKKNDQTLIDALNNDIKRAQAKIKELREKKKNAK